MKLNKSTLALRAMIGVLMLAPIGCETLHRSESQQSEPAPTRTVQRTGYYAPAVNSSQLVTEQAFPTGKASTSAVLVHQVMPASVVRNAEFDSSIHVTNVSSLDLENVVVTSEGLNNIEISQSEPEMEEANGQGYWMLGSIAPGETRIIGLRGVAADMGMAGSCVSVSYESALCATTTVVEPALALTKSVTSGALVCDPIEAIYTVRNPGSGMARGVTISDPLSEGLATADGARRVSINVGDLAAGEERAFRVALQAGQTGSFASMATAASSGGLSAESSEPETVVTQPVLSIEAECGARTILGRNSTLNFVVKNTGDGVANDAVVVAALPAGTSFVSASNSGELTGGRITWRLGALNPGAERRVSMTVKASAIGNITAEASATAACAQGVTDRCESEVFGLPAILLEVVDEADPVEVGMTETYTITVTNQGTAPGTNIAMTCILAEEQELVGVTGSSRATTNGRNITLAPIASLEPGVQLSWRVTVRAKTAGDIRFSVMMKSDQLSSPVNETEATTFYE